MNEPNNYLGENNANKLDQMDNTNASPIDNKVCNEKTMSTEESSTVKTEIFDTSYTANPRPIIIERSVKKPADARRYRRKNFLVIIIASIITISSLAFGLITMISNLSLENEVEFYENSSAFVVTNDSEYYHTYDCDRWSNQSFYVFNTNYAETVLGYKPCPYCHDEDEDDDDYFEDIQILE